MTETRTKLSEAANLSAERDHLNPALRQKVADAVAISDVAQRKAALAAITGSGRHLVRRVRTSEHLEKVEVFRDRRSGPHYRAVKLDSNHRAELWRLPNGKQVLTIVSVFDAAQEAQARARGATAPKDLRPHPAAKLLFRVHKNDVLAIGGEQERRIVRVVKMDSRSIALADVNEGGDLKKRDSNKADSFKYLDAGARRLTELRARKVWIDPAGRVHDPGAKA